MDNNYFETLANAIQDSENTTPEPSVAATATLTVKVDIDCKLYCDGDFLDLFEANKVKKIIVPTGWHLFTIESEQFYGVTEDHEMDVTESGKNYPLVVSGLKEKIQTHIQKRETEKRLQEAEAEKNRREKENLKLAHEAKKNDVVFSISLSHDKIRDTLLKLFIDALEGSSSMYYGLGKDGVEDAIDAILRGETTYIGVQDPENDHKIIYKYVNYSDIVSGLQKAANGTFKAKDEDDKQCARQSFLHLMDYEDDFLLFSKSDAWYLVQVIAYNEIIYIVDDSL